MMEYKGYVGRVEFDDDASILHGEVVNIKDVVTFQAESIAELRNSFRASIDDYLSFCQQRGESPEAPLSGQLVLRIGPELHGQINSAAASAGKSLAVWIVEHLQQAVAQTNPPGRRSKARPSAPRKPRERAPSRNRTVRQGP